MGLRLRSNPGAIPPVRGNGGRGKFNSGWLRSCQWWKLTLENRWGAHNGLEEVYVEQVAQSPVGRREDRRFVLGSLSIGHGISHLYDLGFPLLLKHIAAFMGFSTFQVASLHAIRQAGSGAVNLGAGPLGG